MTHQSPESLDPRKDHDDLEAEGEPAGSADFVPSDNKDWSAETVDTPLEEGTEE